MAFFDDIVGDFTKTFGIEPNNLPLVGSAFTNQNEKDLIKAMEAAAASYRAMGPQHAQAQQNAMQNSASAYVPANSLLAAMGGPGAAIDFEQVFKNPFPEGHPANPAPEPVAPPPTDHSPALRSA